MLHACALRLDVTENLEKFLVFGGELNNALAWCGNRWCVFFDNIDGALEVAKANGLERAAI